jgi:hypothetical protein
MCTLLITLFSRTVYREGEVIILSCRLTLLLFILTIIDFALLWTEKRGFNTYCEQMHSISEHYAYSVSQCICKFVVSRYMNLFRTHKRDCFQTVCCKCIHHLQCTFFFPPEFYSQTATKARQICRI